MKEHTSSVRSPWIRWRQALPRTKASSAVFVVFRGLYSSRKSGSVRMCAHRRRRFHSFPTLVVVDGLWKTRWRPCWDAKALGRHMRGSAETPFSHALTWSPPASFPLARVINHFQLHPDCPSSSPSAVLAGNSAQLLNCFRLESLEEVMPPPTAGRCSNPRKQQSLMKKSSVLFDFLCDRLDASPRRAGSCPQRQSHRALLPSPRRQGRRRARVRRRFRRFRG